MYPYEHMITMECKEVCIPGEVQTPLFEKKKKTVSGSVCALQIVYMTVIVVWLRRKNGKVRVGEGSERKRDAGMGGKWGRSTQEGER